MFARLFSHFSSEDQRRALQWLDEPSAYPGLPEMDDRTRRLQLTLAPSFQPMTSWTIYLLDQDKYRVRRVRWDWSADHNFPLAYKKMTYPTTYGADADMDSVVVKSYLGALEKLSLPMFNLRDGLGLDGVRFGIRRQTFHGFAEFSWWCEPPQGCEAIGDWYHRFVAELESSLPAHTTFLRDGATHPYASKSTEDSLVGEVHASGN